MRRNRLDLVTSFTALRRRRRRRSGVYVLVASSKYINQNPSVYPQGICNWEQIGIARKCDLVRKGSTDDYDDDDI